MSKRNQDELMEMREDMLMEARENERQECMMRDIDTFLLTDVVLEAIDALNALRREVDVYSHDFTEVLEYVEDESNV